MNTSLNTPIRLDGRIYFASDFHFGAPNAVQSRQREDAVLAWLDEIMPTANYLFLLGDIFDFWFEYRDVVPKGYFRFFAKLLEMKQKGVEIYYFTGNHDMWVKDYFENEIGVRIFRAEQRFVINGKNCVIGHGDGLDPNDRGYLFIKKMFAVKAHVALYGALPPRWAFGIARFCSRRSRAQNETVAERSEAKIRQHEQATIAHIRNVLSHEPTDFFIYGHSHRPLQVEIEDGVTYFNTGDWLIHQSFVQWTEAGIELVL